MSSRRKASIDTRALLARKVVVYRKSLNLSQEDLADKAGLHRTYIGSIERCERNPTLSTLEVLADALNITIEDLLAGED